MFDSILRPFAGRRHRCASCVPVLAVTAAIAAPSLLTAPAAATDQDGPTRTRGPATVLELAQSAGSFQTLLAAAKAAGLADALAGDGPFTVFAPTDDAFGRLPDGTVEQLLAEPGRTTLRGILSRHVIAGERRGASDLVQRRSIRSLEGARIELEIGAGGLEVGGARVVQADLEAGNGIVHVIDRVILPPDRDIPKLAEEAGSFGTLLAAVKAAGLADLLGGPGPFTVLAPSDDAFADLPSDALEALLQPANRAVLQDVLKLHVIPGYVYAEEALGGAAVTAASGATVNLRFKDGRLRANEARVITADLDAANGVVHAIDRVLLPDGFRVPAAGRLVFGFFSERPIRSIRELLDLDHSDGIGIDRLTRGSNAERDGLLPGDVIVAADGKRVASGDLDEIKARAGVGGTVRFLVIREIEVEVGVERH